MNARNCNAMRHIASKSIFNKAYNNLARDVTQCVNYSNEKPAIRTIILTKWLLHFLGKCGHALHCGRPFSVWRRGNLVLMVLSCVRVRVVYTYIHTHIRAILLALKSHTTYSVSCGARSVRTICPPHLRIRYNVLRT